MICEFSLHFVLHTVYAGRIKWAWKYRFWIRVSRISRLRI